MFWQHKWIITDVDFYNDTRRAWIQVRTGQTVFANDDHGWNLDTLNREVQSARSAMEAENRKVKDIETHLEQIKERITEIGRAEKKRIIESGRLAAEEMIENAKAYANYRLTMAKKAISDELVDKAVTMAAARHRKGISQEDSDKLVTQFFTDLENSKERLRKKIA